MDRAESQCNRLIRTCTITGETSLGTAGQRCNGGAEITSRALIKIRSSGRRTVMAMHISEDIRPLSDLEENPSKILEQLRETGRPIVITVKGKADAVLMDAKTYEKHLRAANMSRLLAPAEADVAAGRVRSARSFLKEFKNARKISA